LSRPDVQADLRLSPDQAASARQAIHDIHARALALRGKSDTPDTIAARRAIDEAQLAWLGGQLDAAQQLRLRQLDLQWEGPAAILSRPSLATTLALTPQQHEALTKLVEAHAETRAGGAASPAAQDAFAAQALALLDESQRELWNSMTGPIFRPQQAAGQKR
jgi:hypothetical protein